MERERENIRNEEFFQCIYQQIGITGKRIDELEARSVENSRLKHKERNGTRNKAELF